MAESSCHFRSQCQALTYTHPCTLCSHLLDINQLLVISKDCRRETGNCDLTWQALTCRVSRLSILHSSMSSILGVPPTVIRCVAGSSLGHTPAQQSMNQATGTSTSGRPPEGEMSRSHMVVNKVTVLPVECLSLPSCMCASAAKLSICLNISDELCGSRAGGRGECLHKKVYWDVCQLCKL